MNNKQHNYDNIIAGTRGTSLSFIPNRLHGFTRVISNPI